MSGSRIGMHTTTGFHSSLSPKTLASALWVLRTSRGLRRRMMRNQTLRRIYVNPGIKLVRVSVPRYVVRVLG